jgi:hypothetical protein
VRRAKKRAAQATPPTMPAIIVGLAELSVIVSMGGMGERGKEVLTLGP